jgi:hypothetical protein
MHRTSSRSVLRLAVAVLLVSAAGCWGPSRCDVTGQVTYNGAPLDRPGGQIVFVGPNGEQVPAAINSDGSYRAAQVVAGRNRVVVYYPNPEAQGAKRLSAKRSGVEPSPTPAAAAAATPSPFLTPVKYVSVETSELSVEVGVGIEYKVDLTGPPIP